MIDDLTMPLHTNRPLIALIAAVVFTSAAAAQQPRASIRGDVVDPSGAAMANVEVVVTHESTNETRRTRTDAAGRFSVPGLAPGAYRVNIQQAGYGPYVARLELAVNQEYAIRVPLQ